MSIKKIFSEDKKLYIYSVKCGNIIMHSGDREKVKLWLAKQEAK